MFKMTGYDTPGDISKWIWSQGYSGIGPMMNNAPPIIRQILQQAGMKMDPTQYRSVGGYTPQFAQAVNSAVYPGMGFRTEQSQFPQTAFVTQQGGGPQQPQQDVSPYGDFMTKMMQQYGKGQDQQGLMDILQMMQEGKI